MASTAIELPPLNIQTMDIIVIGDTPLICHAWSSKAKKAMLDKQMKKAKPGKVAKDPEADFNESLYPVEGGGYGFPVIAFKNAAVTACTSVEGVTKVAARQAFRVGGTLDGAELEVVAQAWAELQAWRTRHAELVEFATLFAVIDTQAPKVAEAA